MCPCGLPGDGGMRCLWFNECCFTFVSCKFTLIVLFFLHTIRVECLFLLIVLVLDESVYVTQSIIETEDFCDFPLETELWRTNILLDENEFLCRPVCSGCVLIYVQSGLGQTKETLSKNKLSFRKNMRRKTHTPTQQILKYINVLFS